MNKKDRGSSVIFKSGTVLHLPSAQMTTTLSAHTVISGYGLGPLNTVNLGTYDNTSHLLMGLYRGADKSLARPTSHCILFDGENISFDAILVIHINSTNIPPIMIINRIYENQNLLSL
jgi:hypothetical protein